MQRKERAKDNNTKTTKLAEIYDFDLIRHCSMTSIQSQ